GGSTITRLFGLLALGGFGVAGFGARRLVRPPRAAIWWGVFVVWAIASAGWAVDVEVFYERLPTMLSLFALYLAAVSIRPTRKELCAVCVLLVVGGVVAGATTYLYGGFDDTVAGTMDRQGRLVRGTLVLGEAASNPNALGMAVGPSLNPFLGACVSLRSAPLWLLAVASVGVMALGLLLSMSRGALVSALVALGVLILRMGVRKQIIAVIAALVVLTAVLPSTLFTRIEAVYSGDDRTGSGRTDIWK